MPCATTVISWAYVALSARLRMSWLRSLMMALAISTSDVVRMSLSTNTNCCSGFCEYLKSRSWAGMEEAG
eukprot:CAMPEP_0184359164 /NCGR_PEP_ID=MMETSP1089-20130417/118744_2 /TAXON_ID=38269 ORGANISM="Gloeochaete wittrockiana, Strain SAG46.84" /NCGR_SAMPLE_ID=MMETSP1089 /ASSEMBLY_ACC=CAM_ASM_000445 /LENGTH=69 /DNA_ID=CAMNT_0026697843 /DNA_START=114 /DNA_END=323 /DNA_ORIENTATION=-